MTPLCVDLISLIEKSVSSLIRKFSVIPPTSKNTERSTQNPKPRPAVGDETGAHLPSPDQSHLQTLGCFLMTEILLNSEFWNGQRQHLVCTPMLDSLITLSHRHLEIKSGPLACERPQNFVQLTLQPLPTVCLKTVIFVF